MPFKWQVLSQENVAGFEHVAKGNIPLDFF
jgi:hypothetical protein